ncbi:MAG: GNAT family N-acetyltransferase [Stackebrandtia sp.]
MARLWAAAESVAVHRLGPAELPACLDLAADRGWPREDHKWRLLFDIGEVYGITDPDGRVVGTTVLTRYGTVCAISMVLVAERFDGQGLGKRMMTEVMRLTGDTVVTLYATSYGRPLYEKLGFSVVCDNVTYVGRFEPTDGPELSRPATGADLPAIIELDREVHGADRSALVSRLPSFCSQLRVIERDGRISGYAGAWDNLDKVVAGPVVAADADAEALLDDLARAVAAPIRLEVLHEFGEVGAWAVSRGLAPTGTTSFMVLHGRALPGDAARRFSPVSVALG